MNDIKDIFCTIVGDVDFVSPIEIDEYILNDKARSYFDLFKEYYTAEDTHKYCEILSFINENTQDTIHALIHGLNSVLDYATSMGYNNKLESEDYRCFQKINKLIDYIRLENMRFSDVRRLKTYINSQNSLYKKTEEELSKARLEIKKSETKATKLSEQLISILGIFAGIVVTFSFATSTVGQVIANLAKTDVLYLVFVIFAVGVVFLNVLTFLMVFITKLSGHKFERTFPTLIYIVANLVLLILILIMFFYME